MQLSAHVLGGIEFHVDDQAVAVGGPRQRRLLGALLIRRGEVVPTSRLIEAVWTGAPPAAAERTFRSYVARLRRAFDDAGIDGADIIDTGPSGYSICGEIELDAASFEADLDIARRQLDLGDVDAAQRHVERALEAWSGNAFGEFADEEWAIAEAVRLEELRWVARELGVDIDIERGNLDAAIADALRLTEQQPLRERPHRLLMLAYYRRGRQMEALRVGREYGDRLRDETGLDPSGEFTDLEARVFSSDLSLDAQIATRTIRGYRLGDVLVATDHSVTYRANRAEHPGQLALTIVSMDIADDATFVRDFEHEARRRASILHPGLAPWLDHWREPGSAYVVVRLPSGGLLRDRLTTSEPWAIESARRLVRDVGDALSALHRSAIAFGELNVDDIWFEGDRPLLVGPIVGIGATTARDDVVSFARLVRDAFARGGAPSELTDAQIDRLDRLMAAVSDRGEPQIAPLVDEILWLLGDGPRPCTPAGEVMNPYRGLEPFHERHARWFFGRSNATEELDIELRRSAFVTVVGPSGSGKSSLVRAGLVPRTRADGWLTTVMQPGSHPINELALALAAVATAEVPLADDPTSVVAAINGVVSGEQQLLLVVDQFEELWTVAEPTQRDALLSGLELLAASEGQQVHIVATLRADYLGHALSHPAIGALVRDHTTLLAPMTTAELAEAILEPAQVVGVTVEADLAAAIVVDAGRSEGSLPLVQFALMELFERRTADVMTLRAYRQIGGLGGVVSRRAEDIFQRLSDEEQAAAEVALTRLVSVDSVGDPTRRRVPSAELTEAAATVVAAFGDGRLLTFDRDRSTREQTVEIAHESLAREWSRLRDWLDADQESLAVLRRLSAATRSWAASGHDSNDLYRGARLEVAEDWLRAHPGGLTTTEAEFLTASRDAADSVRRSERQRARRLRTLALGLAVALIAVAAAGTVALIQRRSAVDNAEQATMKSIEATAQRLSTQAIDAIDIDPDLAILLGLESVRRTDDAGLAPVAGAVEALHTVTQSSRLLARFTGYSVSAMHPNGSTAVMARWGGPDLVSMDLSTGTERTRTSFDDDINGLWFHPDGTRVVVATTNGLVLLDASDLAATDEWPIECCVTRVEFHDDGDLIAASFDWESSRGVQIYDLSGALQSRTIDDGHVAGWLGDDVVAHDDDTVHRIGPSGLRQELARSEQGIVSVDVDTNSKRLLVGDAAGVTVTTLDSLAEQQSVDIDGWGVLIDTVRFSSDSGGIIASGQTDEVRLVPLDGTRPRSFRGNPTNGLATTDTRAGRILVSGFSNETLLWDLTPEGPPGLGAIGVAGDVWDITFSADGDVVYITDELADVARVRAVGRSERATIAESSFRSPRFNGVPAAATGLIAGLAPDGTSHVQRLLTGEIVTTLSPCDVPAAIDGAERWLLLAYVDDLDGLDCPTSLGRVVDPLTGELLLDLPEGVGLSDIGPPGTISDGLAAYQDVMSGAAGESLVIRDLRSGELVGRLDDGDLWRPFFSDDGRYLAIGSGGAGGFAIDMARVLAGDSVEDAIVLNPRLDGATTFSVVAGDRLVTGHAGDVLRFWRLVDGKQDLTLPVDSGDSTFIATSPGDRYLYYEDAGPVLRRFPLDRDELVDLAVRRLQRGFHVDECERYLLADDCNAFVASR